MLTLTISHTKMTFQGQQLQKLSYDKQTDGATNGPVPVSVGAKLSFVEPDRRWAHSPFPSKGPGIPGYYENLREDVKNLGRPQLLYGASFSFLKRFRWAPKGFFFLWTMTGSPVSCKELSSCGRVPTRGPSSEFSFFHFSPSSVIWWGHGGWGVPGLVAFHDIGPGDRVGLF